MASSIIRTVAIDRHLEQQILSEIWKGLDKGAKKPFEEMAAQDKLRYKKEMDDYQKLQGS